MKTCITCKHCRATKTMRSKSFKQCLLTIRTIEREDLVRGKWTFDASAGRCVDARFSGKCGKDGRFHEPRTTLQKLGDTLTGRLKD